MTATITETDSLAAGKRRSAQLEDQVTADASRFRVLTGDRPTGPPPAAGARCGQARVIWLK